MALLDLFFPKDVDKYGATPPADLNPAYAARLPQMDTETLALHQELPRGVDMLRRRPNRELDARWANQAEMADFYMPETYRAGKLPQLPLGCFNDRLVGYNDDKAMITVASARAGKTTTCLEPILFTYPGSMLVFDPKGELADDTAEHREKVLGQRVHRLAPFWETGSAFYNILDELDIRSKRIIDDVYSIVRSIVLQEDHSSQDGSFWLDGGRHLLAGVILSVLILPDKADRHLVTVQQLLTGAHPVLRAQLEGKEFRSDAARNAFIEGLLLNEMAKPPRHKTDCPQRVLEVIMGIGSIYASMPDRTRGSMLATARGATIFLDSLALQDISKESHFSLGDLRSDQPTTIYLVLPGGNEIDIHYRWLRMLFEQAAAVLMRKGRFPHDEPPIIFMMEEFPVLGHLKTISKSAAALPGYGIKLHLVAQNMSQIQDVYPHDWRVFFANAGLVQMFANNDQADLEYISEWLGQVSFERPAATFSKVGEDTRTTLPLMAPNEIRRVFARNYGAQILMIPGFFPYAFMRLKREQVEALRQNRVHGRMSLQPSDALRLSDQSDGLGTGLGEPAKRPRGRPRKH